MKITINRKNDAYLMEAINDTGNTIMMDGTPALGGVNGGMRPMQTVLAAMGGCSTIDVIMILQKQKQVIEDIQIELTGERHMDRVAKTFKKIHAHYKVFGDIDDKKVERAVNLSMEKYCSVSKMLEPTVEITHSFEVVRS